MVTEEDFAEANQRLEQAKDLLWKVELAVLNGHLECEDFMLRNAITMCKSAPSALGALISRVNKVKQGETNVYRRNHPTL